MNRQRRDADWTTIIKVQSTYREKYAKINPKNKKEIDNGKKYTVEERAEAVKLAKEIGTRAAAERLDINIDTLYNWLSKEKKLEEQTRPKPSQTELEKEVERLRKALERSVTWFPWSICRTHRIYFVCAEKRK